MNRAADAAPGVRLARPSRGADVRNARSARRRSRLTSGAPRCASGRRERTHHERRHEPSSPHGSAVYSGDQMRDGPDPVSVSSSSFSRLTNAAGSSICPPSASVAWSKRIWLQSLNLTGIDLVAEPSHQRMRGVHLEDRLRGRHRLAGRLHQPLQVGAEAVAAADEARRRFGQARRHPDRAGPVGERRLHALEQQRMFARRLGVLRRRRLAADGAEIEVLGCRRLQRLAVELVRATRPPTRRCVRAAAAPRRRACGRSRGGGCGGPRRDRRR